MLDPQLAENTSTSMQLMKSVLIVDRDVAQQQFLAEALSAEGYISHNASESTEALEFIDAFEPSVVLADLTQAREERH